MNREIEFRAYIKNENIMIDVPIIDFRKSAKCIRTIYGQTNANEWKYKFNDIVLMQYTGLKDKNGKKIFEGDILREYSNEIEDWIVSYEYGKFIGTFDNVCEDLYELSDLEIIGNIYVIKEVLESKGEE